METRNVRLHFVGVRGRKMFEEAMKRAAQKILDREDLSDEQFEDALTQAVKHEKNSELPKKIRRLSDGAILNLNKDGKTYSLPNGKNKYEFDFLICGVYAGYFEVVK